MSVRRREGSWPRRYSLLVAVAVGCLLSGVCGGVKFEVTAYSKCIGEEIQEGVLVVGSYHVVAGEHSHGHHDDHKKISVKVSPWRWCMKQATGQEGSSPVCLTRGSNSQSKEPD